MFDTEKFILEVEKRPAIYDLTVKEYLNKEYKIRLWEEIGREMYQGWDQLDDEERDKLGKELQIKWKSIRDQLRKEVVLEKKVESGQLPRKKKKYIYYDHLQFLINCLEKKANWTNNLDINKEIKIKSEDAETSQIVGITGVENETRIKIVKREFNEFSETDPLGSTGAENETRIKIVKLECNESAETDPLGLTNAINETRRKMIKRECNGSAETDPFGLTGAEKQTRIKIVKRECINESARIDPYFPSILAPSVELYVQENEEDVMGNKSFLQSLLPLMNSMPQNDVIELRLKIMQLFNTYCNTKTV